MNMSWNSPCDETPVLHGAAGDLENSQKGEDTCTFYGNGLLHCVRFPGRGPKL